MGWYLIGIGMFIIVWLTMGFLRYTYGFPGIFETIINIVLGAYIWKWVKKKTS